MHRLLIAAMLVGMMIPTLGFCDTSAQDTTVTTTTTIFYKQVPVELTKKLTEQIASYKKKYAITDELIKYVRTPIESKDIKHLNPDEIQQSGKVLIPAIAEMLVSEDEKVRQNAVVALGMSFSYNEQTPKEMEEDDSLRGLLFRRTLFDKNKQVRMLAVNYTKRLAFARLENIPEDVTIGLKEALKDPDQEIRETADMFIKWIDESVKELKQRESNP